jgi:erythromycin esterase-like protein
MMKGLPLLFVLFISCHSPAKIMVTAPVSSNDTAFLRYHPLKSEADLDILIKEIGDKKIVLLGESTHGTHEFYQWRTAITKRLIEEKGFDFIGIEGDWVDTYRVNELVQGKSADSTSIIRVLQKYDRWPSAMWGNFEFYELVKWLNKQNQQKPPGEKLAIYGLDLYSFWEWSFTRLPVRDLAIEKQAFAIRQAFDSMDNDALRYAAAFSRSNLNLGSFTQRFYEMVAKLPRPAITDTNFFKLEQFALLGQEGEKYFRSMVEGKVGSWNIRELYMTKTINRLLQLHGKESKAIIWVHNGHAGDADYSQMDEGGYTSIGEELKKQKGSDVFSVCFGMNKGTVLAGYYWNAPLMEMPVPDAREGSWENIVHKKLKGNVIILSREIKDNRVFNTWLPFRSIGAAYSNNAIYGSAILPKRFDAIVYIDSTTAIRPIK